MEKIEKLNNFRVKRDIFSKFLYTCGIKINYFTHFESHDSSLLEDLIVNQFKMIILTKGACKITFNNNGNAFELKEKDICIIPPMTLHSGLTTVTPFEVYEIFFEFKPIAKETELINLISIAQPCIVENCLNKFHDDEVELLYRSVMSESNSSYVGVLNFICQVLGNRYINLEEISSDRYNQREIQIFRAAYHYLEEHYHEPISVSDLCSNLAISQSYLFRAINNIAQISPSTFIHKYKMIQAEKLLKATDISIEDIALELGYNNIYYFSTTFKKTFGISPSNYRKSSSELF